ncbi:MAG: polyphosphate polymerase domain-containing protein [Planctomycetes bacterium]|nr:polyphosphate polymerase domain-containing protein [Planctomycetota bacterium]
MKRTEIPPSERQPVGGPPDRALSPSLRTGEDAELLAFELKFLLEEPAAGGIERWAREALRPDPHGLESLGGAYDVTTTYLDTPGFDVFHRVRELQGAKLRLRRYGGGGMVWLERKQRRGERVQKRRTAVPAGEVGRLGGEGPGGEWAGDWFREEIGARGFRPACMVGYRRSAWHGDGDHGGFRMTLDRGIRGAAAAGWQPAMPARSIEPAGGKVVCELKFAAAMPQMFKELVARFGLAVVSMSKYRTMCEAAGLVTGKGGGHA